MNGQTMVKALVQLPLGATAVYSSSGLAYIRHTDHLGSSRLATTPARAMYASAAYAPYGEAYAVQGTTDLSFTGQDQGTTSGMYDFMVRKYNPVQGRWLSPDPAGLGAVDPANPQTWNRYAYVGNNPLSLIDPLGADAYEGCKDNPACYYIDPFGIRYMMSGWGDPFLVGTIPVKVEVPLWGWKPIPLSGMSGMNPQNTKTGGTGVVLSLSMLTYFGQTGVTIGKAFTTLGWEVLSSMKDGDAAFNARYPDPNPPATVKAAPPPSEDTIRQAVSTACLMIALDANNGTGGSGYINPTLPSSPDAVAPTGGPNVSLYSQRNGQEPFDAQFEAARPLTEPQGDFALLPPAAYVDLTYRSCLGAHGF